MTKFSAPQQNQLAQIGAFLRENREKQEKSLEDIAIRTYIRPQLLNGIETGNPDTLPEPIFVQGFIRRYGEALGLNGLELSQQFTVSSIPSTPRPAPPEPLSDSPTTRLTRAGSAQMPMQPTGAPAPAIPDIPILANAAPSGNGAAGGNSANGAPADMDSAEALTLGRVNNEPASAISFDADGFSEDTVRTSVDSGATELSSGESRFDSDSDIPVFNSFDGTVSDAEASGLDASESGAAELEPASDPDEDQDFSSMVAAFDRENLNRESWDSPDVMAPDMAASTPAPSEVEPSGVGSTAPDSRISDSRMSDSQMGEQAAMPTLAASAAETALTETVGIESGAPQSTSFADDLPAAFTTEATVSEPTELSAPADSRPVESVGELEYGDSQTNLKPFVVGGIIAAIALLGVIIAGVIGSSRQPSVAEDPDPVEQVEDGSVLPPLPEETDVVESPPPAISDAPIYVEGTALREAWVSVIADGETVFEEILQPGDSALWEAEESLSIYSGDAGALELAANGADAEVMGEAGQPDERIFP